MNDSDNRIAAWVIGFGVLFILALLLVPVIGLKNKKSNRHNCLGQLRQIALAMKAYAGDNGEQYFPRTEKRPSNSNELFEEFLTAQGYVKDTKMFRCPSDKAVKPRLTFPAPDTNSYSVAHNLK